MSAAGGNDRAALAHPSARALRWNALLTAALLGVSAAVLHLQIGAPSRAAPPVAPNVLLVSIDRGGAKKALPFLEMHGVATVENVKFGFDPRAKLSREMEVRGLPTSFVLPPGQQDAWRFVGPFEWDEPEMLEMVRKLVAD